MKHIIKLAMVALAVVATYYVAMFTAQVAPLWVAVAASGSLVCSYVGLAFADIPQAQQRQARAVAVAAMVIEALYGFLYVLHVQSPAVFAAPLPLWLSVPLAALHGAPFTVLLYFVSLFIVHGNQSAPSVTATATRDDAIVASLASLTQLVDVVVARLDTDPQPARNQVAPEVAPVAQIEDGQVSKREQILDLHEEGLSQSEIARQIGCTRQYVGRVLAEETK